MSDSGPKSGPLALPRDRFRAQRTAESPTSGPVVVTPLYEDQPVGQGALEAPRQATKAETSSADYMKPLGERRPAQPAKERAGSRNPFEAYGERSSARPYALRLPDAIDLTLRQMAAEERTHPLRVIDRILYEHLKTIGRLPPPQNDR